MPAPLIVVVDDYPTMLDLYTDVLEYQGYRVTTCQRGSDVVACVQREHPDLVILDLWLETPQGGWAIYQALAEDPTTASLPIILVTDSTTTWLQQPTGLPSSSVEILIKPFWIDELLSAVERALAASTHRFQPPAQRGTGRLRKG